MGLKCSVLGHKYGDATVERDREEQGSEVVITIREMEACDRCGSERIVSENKEVTSIATPDEPDDPEASVAAVDADDDGPGAVEPDETTANDDAADAPGTATDASAVGPDESDAADEPADAATDVPDPSTVTDDSSSPVESNEGAEILDAESDDPVTDDELADPSIGDATDDDPMAADSVEEDAVIIDEDDTEEKETGDGREPGEWPEEPVEDDEEAWAPSDALDDEPIDAPDAGTEQNTAVTVPDGQFRCPECGYTTPVEASSLRAGDFCPDCHRGSLVHEPRD